jgi:hypothetical protein
VPAPTPVITPVDEPIVAIEETPSAQWPPEVASLIVIVEPTATVVLPVIAAGTGLTVMVAVAIPAEE